jgi:predicted transcriptional regulator
MKTRVTITLDPEVHRRAKQVARKKHTTVSGLIETLLQAEATPKKSSLVAEMTGIARLREPAPGTDPRYDALKAKYIR